MKKLQLEKSAIDFAYDNYAETDQLALSQKVNDAFVKAGFNSADYSLWTARVASYLQLFARLAVQVVPSAAIQPKPSAPAAPATAAVESAPQDAARPA